MQNFYINELELIGADSSPKAALCCCFFSNKTAYENVVQHLHTQERHYYNTLQFDKRIRSYLIGRFAAKQSVAALTGAGRLSDIFIQSGIFTQPVVASDKQNIQVSITHCDDIGAALAFPETHPMGIDIEKIDINKRTVFEGQITDHEQERIISLPISYDIGLTLLWTAKEALSKVLKTGLTTPFSIFEISNMESYDNYTICYFKYFAQYKTISFSVCNYICSIVYPLKTKVYFNIQFLKEFVNYFS